eukprot:6456446-Amphidinium_carterae.1
MSRAGIVCIGSINVRLEFVVWGGGRCKVTKEPWMLDFLVDAFSKSCPVSPTQRQMLPLRKDDQGAHLTL